MNVREKKILKYVQMALPKKKKNLNASFVMKYYNTVPLFNSCKQMKLKLCAWPWVACVASEKLNENQKMKEGDGKEGTPDDSIKCRCVNRQA